MATPSAHEQYQLELINRARLDPQAESNRLGIGLNEGLPGGTISSAAKQPLAFNTDLIDAARGHSNWMLSADIFDHDGAGGSSPGDRMRDAGYQFTGSWTWGENISWRGTTGTPDVTEFVTTSYVGLFDSAGHRENTLNGTFEEIGLGIREGVFTSRGTDYNSVMVTQNYAKSGSKNFITGVAYEDRDNDDFYSPGEGLGGITVTIDPSSGSNVTARTYSSGGYQAQVGTGQHDVTFSGGGLPRALTVSITVPNENVKLDLIDQRTIASSVSVTAGSNTAALALLGFQNINATGNGQANELTGNRGANRLSGEGGNDTLTGGAGNDSLIGGSGTDTAVYSGNRASYTVTETANGHQVRARSGSDGTDQLSSVEKLKFADQTVTLGGSPDPDPDPDPGPDPDPDPDPPGNSATQVGGSGVDVMTGGSENNNFQGRNGADTLTGKGGDDRLSGQNGTDKLYGGAGDDDMFGGRDNDKMFGGSGSDEMWGGQGRDGMQAGDHADTLKGEDGDDVMNGNRGNDTAYGGDGIDRINGGQGDDKLYGGDDADIIRGDQGNDSLFGGNGNDVMSGSRGNDLLNGGSGSDTARYSGDMDRYRISKNGSNVKIRDLSGKDGEDTLISVETVRFADKTVSTSSLLKGADSPASLAADDLLSDLAPGVDSIDDLLATLGTSDEAVPGDGQWSGWMNRVLDKPDASCDCALPDGTAALDPQAPPIDA